VRRLLRFVLAEARDWIFALGAVAAAVAVPAATGGDAALTLLVLGGFVALYVGALCLSARVLGETPPADGSSRVLGETPPADGSERVLGEAPPGDGSEPRDGDAG